MSQKESIRQLINAHYRRLMLLKERQARQGVAVDPSILLEIEDIESTIHELENELREQERVKSIPPSLREQQYQIALNWATDGRGSSLARFDLSQTDLQAVDLRGADLTGADFSGANLSAAYLRGANLHETDLSMANLENADLSRADLSGANLFSANLRGVSLRGANLTKVDLSEANLSGANLFEVNFFEANFQKTNLSDARVRHTIFAAVNLSKVKGLDTVKHFGPSSIGIDTIYGSGYRVSKVFLQRAGVPNEFIQLIETASNEVVSSNVDSSYISEIENHWLNSLRQQLVTLSKNLAEKQLIKANYGINVPIDVINEIRYLEKEITRVKEEIAKLEKT